MLPTRAEDNFLLKPEDLAAAINSKTRMIILCNPSCVASACAQSGKPCALTRALCQRSDC